MGGTPFPVESSIPPPLHFKWNFLVNGMKISDYVFVFSAPLLAVSRHLSSHVSLHDKKNIWRNPNQVVKIHP